MMMRAPMFALMLTLGLASSCKKADDRPAAPEAKAVTANPGDPAPAEPAPAMQIVSKKHAALIDSAVVGKPAPEFTLTDMTGTEVSLASFKGKTVVLEWFNPGCPYVKKSHTVGSLVDTAKRHTAKGVVWLAINSGAEGKQGHDPAANTEAAKTWKMEHPILRDLDGGVGKAYGATNTPNMFVIDPEGIVVYGGAIDNSPDGEGKSAEGGALVNHVEAALEDVAAGRPVRTPVTKPYGCGVKYAS